MTARSCFDLSANDPKADIKAEAYWFTQMFLGDIIARVKEHIDHRIRPFLTQQERSGENEAGHRARQTSRDEGIVCKTRLKAGGIRWNWVYYSQHAVAESNYKLGSTPPVTPSRWRNVWILQVEKWSKKHRDHLSVCGIKVPKRRPSLFFDCTNRWQANGDMWRMRFPRARFQQPPCWIHGVSTSSRNVGFKCARIGHRVCAVRTARPAAEANSQRPKKFYDSTVTFSTKTDGFFLPCFRFSLILRQSEIIGCLNKLFARVGQYWCFPLSFCPRCIDLSQYWVLGPTAKNRLAIICLKIMRRDRNGAIATCVKLLEMVQSSRTCARHVTVTFVSSLTGTRWFSLQLQFFSTLFTSFRRMVP